MFVCHSVVLVSSTPAPTSAPSFKRRWIFAPLLFGFIGSSVTHGSVALAMLFGAPGGPVGSGEGGHSGAGDTTIDVSLAGNPAAADPTPPAPAETTPPPPPQTPPQTKETPPPPPPEEANAVEPAPPPAETAPPEAPVPPPATGGGAETTSGGKAPGPIVLNAPNTGLGGNTIEGQRALLPSAATCKDPIVGTWQSLKYNPALGEWVQFSLAVHRGASGAITGTILSHTWSGGAFDRVPPPCTRGAFDMTVSMPASGRDDGRGGITFGATHFVILSMKCYAPESTYAPDSFSGKIDGTRQEFQSVNNDGANDIDAPYVFRRTGCLDE